MSRRAWLWIAAAVCVALFLADALAIHEPWMRTLDHHWLVFWRKSGPGHALIGPHWALKAVIGVTTLGSAQVRVPVMIVAVLVFALHARGRQAALLGGAVAAGAIAMPLLKLCFDRPRPDFLWHLVIENDWSFPSGHAMGSMILYPLLGAIVGAPRGRAFLLAGIGVLLAGLIGASRIILGVHWVSDVIGGWLIGAAILFAACAIAQPRRR